MINRNLNTTTDNRQYLRQKNNERERNSKMENNNWRKTRDKFRTEIHFANVPYEKRCKFRFVLSNLNQKNVSEPIVQSASTKTVF